MKILIATAVDAERDAVLAGLVDAGEALLGSGAGARTRDSSSARIEVATVGVGPASAAAGTAFRLARTRYDAVVSAGVAGGMPGRAGIGDVVLATRSIAADLGAESPDGFLPISQLGFGTGEIAADPFLRHPAALTGAVLTVSTVTGTLPSTEALARRYPDAVAEAMEGFGVATAASHAGVRFGELRTVSNLVGPREKAAWRLDEALRALTDAVATVTKELTT